MYLMPSDTEKLLLATAGMVARDRLERGVRLNYPETVALLCTWVIERARDGMCVSDIMAQGTSVLTPDQVMDDVPGLLTDVQVEATFPDGRKLVTLHYPLGRADDGPGKVTPQDGECEINHGRESLEVTITNTGDRPIQVGSHLHLPHANGALEFDRHRTRGYRLDVPAGTSVRFEPGVAHTVTAVSMAGRRHVPGIQIRD